jgi:hypothetical protein
MAAAIALRAVFGQDEANHGMRRYRVGPDGIVWVPPEVAVHLLKNGGFVAASEPTAPHPLLDAGGKLSPQTGGLGAGGEQSETSHVLGS